MHLHHDSHHTTCFHPIHQSQPRMSSTGDSSKAQEHADGAMESASKAAEQAGSAASQAASDAMDAGKQTTDDARESAADAMAPEGKEVRSEGLAGAAQQAGEAVSSMLGMGGDGKKEGEDGK